MNPVAEEDIEVREDGKEYNRKNGRRVYRVFEPNPDNRAARRRREVHQRKPVPTAQKEARK